MKKIYNRTQKLISRGILCLLILCTANMYVANAEDIAKINAQVGAIGENLNGEAGWVSLNTNSNHIVSFIDDNGTALQVADNGNTNPGAYHWYTAGDGTAVQSSSASTVLSDMYTSGWRYELITKAVSNGGFTAWNTKGAPSNTFDANKRYGGFITISDSYTAFKPLGGSKITSPNANEYIRIVLWGEPEQKTYNCAVYDMDYNQIGTTQTGLSPTSTNNGDGQGQVKVMSGSSSAQNRIVNYKSIELGLLDNFVADTDGNASTINWTKLLQENSDLLTNHLSIINNGFENKIDININSDKTVNWDFNASIGQLILANTATLIIDADYTLMPSEYEDNAYTTLTVNGTMIFNVDENDTIIINSTVLGNGAIENIGTGSLIFTGDTSAFNNLSTYETFEYTSQQDITNGYTAYGYDWSYNGATLITSNTVVGDKSLTLTTGGYIMMKESVLVDSTQVLNFTSNNTEDCKLAIYANNGGEWILCWTKTIAGSEIATEHKAVLEFFGTDVEYKIVNEDTSSDFRIDEIYINKTQYGRPTFTVWNHNNNGAWVFGMDAVTINDLRLREEDTDLNDDTKGSPYAVDGSEGRTTGAVDYYINWSKTDATNTAQAMFDIAEENTITILENNGRFSNKMHYHVWLDLNGDGEFDDDNELIGSKTNQSAASGSFTLNCTLPEGSMLGLTRMRIRNKCQANVPTLGANENCSQPGETEDYVVTIYNSQAVVEPIEPTEPTNADYPIENFEGVNAQNIENGYTAHGYEWTYSDVTLETSGAVVEQQSATLASGAYIIMKDTASVDSTQVLNFTTDNTEDCDVAIYAKNGDDWVLCWKNTIYGTEVATAHKAVIEITGTDVEYKIINIDNAANLRLDEIHLDKALYGRPSFTAWNNSNNAAWVFGMDAVSINNLALREEDTDLNDDTKPSPYTIDGTEGLSTEAVDYYINWSKTDAANTTQGIINVTGNNTITILENNGRFSDGKLNFYVWLDSNGDGEFDNTNELIGSKTNQIGAQTSFTLDYELPDGAVVGLTRMRVRGFYSNNSSIEVNENSTGYGETEDYVVYITDEIVEYKSITPALTFTDNMVIQRGSDIRIYGTTLENSIGATIELSLVNNSNTEVYNSSNTISAVAEDGTFMTDVPADLEASTEEHTLNISLTDGNGHTYDSYSYINVLIGDVYIAAGQSNMKLKMSEYHGSGDFTEVNPHTANTVFDGENFPNVRFFKTAESYSSSPTLTPSIVNSGWTPATNTSVDANFSAVAYFYACNINKATKEANAEVPVGVIIGSVGGTVIESWMDEEGLDLYDSFAHAKALKDGENTPYSSMTGWSSGSNAPSACFNYHHNLTRNFACKGFIWYQGEYNFGKSENFGTWNYKQQLTDLIDRWRTIFNCNGEEASFYVVELATHKYTSHFNNSDPKAFGMFRSNIHNVETLPNVRVITIGDDVTSNTVYNGTVDTNMAIHPSRKDMVAARLSTLALADIYDLYPTGAPVATASSNYYYEYSQTPNTFDYPKATAFTVSGNKIIIAFDNAEGLELQDGTQNSTWVMATKRASQLHYDLAVFEVAANDAVFSEVSSVSVNGSTVELTLSDATTAENVSYVRYAWDEMANVNLKNAVGLPTTSFCLGTQKEVETNLSYKSQSDAAGVVRAGAAAPLAVSSAITIEAWVNPSLNKTWNTIVSQWYASGSTYSSFIFAIQNGVLFIGLHSNDGTTDLEYNTGIEITQDEWSHVAFTYSKTNEEVLVYLNGDNVASTSFSKFIKINNAQDVEIGSYNSGVGRFQGGIDELRIWRRALSATEIMHNMDAILLHDAAASQYHDLVMCYGFDELDETSTSIVDMGSRFNTIDGTAVSTITRTDIDISNVWTAYSTESSIGMKNSTVDFMYTEPAVNEIKENRTDMDAIAYRNENLIRISGDLDTDAIISIYSLDGKICQQHTGNISTIDMSASRHGLYIVSVQTSTESFSKKIIW